jgi:hypothetical protein
MFLIHGLVGLTIVATGYALWKHMSFSQVKTVVLTLEAAAVTDAKAVLAAIKARL